jgi:hypothetical protein
VRAQRAFRTGAHHRSSTDRIGTLAGVCEIEQRASLAPMACGSRGPSGICDDRGGTSPSPERAWPGFRIRPLAMTLPVAPPVVSPQPDDRARGRRARTEAYLQGAAEPLPDRHFGLVRDESDVRSRWDDALATLVMDRFRRTRDATAFDHLADLVGPMLLRRARFRLRCCRVNLDPDEVVQDVLVNVYRYPDRFDGSRPRAFRAWVATILDNVIRRQLRPIAPDRVGADPSQRSAGRMPRRGRPGAGQRADGGEACRACAGRLSVGSRDSTSTRTCR